MNRHFSPWEWAIVWAVLLLAPVSAVAQSKHNAIGNELVAFHAGTTQSTYYRGFGTHLGSGVLEATATTKAAPARRSPWQLSVDFSWVNPSGRVVATGTGDAKGAVNLGAGVGAGLRVEYQFSNRLGVEVGALASANLDITLGGLDNAVEDHFGVSSFSSATVGLNVHLTPGRPIDLYAGPLLAFVRYSGIRVGNGIRAKDTPVSIDNDVGFGAVIGLDVSLGDRGWLVQANLRYIDIDMIGSSGAISAVSEFNPVIFSIGLGYRF